MNARLKSDIDDLYIDKLKTAHIDLSILCNVVKKKQKKTMLLKRLCMMNWLLLLKKVNDVQIIDSTGFLKKN